MLQIVMSKNKDLSPTEIQNITHEMATCAMKWTMLSASARTVCVRVMVMVINSSSISILTKPCRWRMPVVHSYCIILQE